MKTLGKARRFRGFPKKGGGGGNTGYDLERIKQEYLESPVVEWSAYCGTRGYNPGLYALPWQKWVREKKYRNAWTSVRDELENEGLQLGPKLLLRQVRAVRQIPETASAMLSLLQHAIQVHMQEARHDQNLMAAAAREGKERPDQPLRFSAGSQDLMLLASAMKQTGELLYKSLGIDSSVGVSAAKWLGLVETELGQMEGNLDPKDQTNLVTVEVLGGSTMREAIGDAMARYLDRPGTTEVLTAGERPEGMSAEDRDPLEDGELLDPTEEDENARRRR